MLIDMITSYRKSMALYTFVDLGIPKYMINNSCDLDCLSKELNITSDRIYRFMEYLVSIGVISKYRDCYSLNQEFLPLLNQNSIEYLWIKTELSPQYWQSWSKYSESMRANISAFEIYHKDNFFSFLNENNELDYYFHKLMSKISLEFFEEFKKYINMSNNYSVLDIGGGDGSFANSIKKYYGVREVSVLDKMVPDDIIDNINYIKGSFFDKIISEYDIYIAKNILHDWNDDMCIKILKNIRNSMKKDSQIIVIEIIKSDENNKGKGLDIVMDMLFLSKERYIWEYERIFKASGFFIKSINHTNLPQSIITLGAI